MFKKVCFSPSGNVVSTHQTSDVLANPKLVERMTKLANGIKTIAPRSDDFLYFSIIFLKSAESAILDESGNIKKTSSGEDAWGFFDENWKWHGNVKPHRNNNRDIFPESELKIAAKKWIGMPLCRDHESSSVDGIRGIILDAHYDEKFKQVVGLCALDKVNYPDLARKVQTGLVRYGSMGTAVETSVCTECGNKARVQKEYCEHVNSRVAHGEINVGLKPIEYSLVVQPAEPGAVLLKCIASLKDYSQEFINYGVDNVEDMLGKLSVNQAQHLEGIMKTACGEDGCSVSERRKIVRSFLQNNSLLKNSSQEDSATDFVAEQDDSNVQLDALNLDKSDIGDLGRNYMEILEKVEDPNTLSEHRAFLNTVLEKIRKDYSAPAGESFTSPENYEGTRGPGDTPMFSSAPGNSGANSLGGGDTGDYPDFSSPDDLLSRDSANPSGGGAVTVASSKEDHSVKTANNNNKTDYVDDFSINSIMEDIMNESRLRKRAELRRKIAYMQGGAEGREPNTFKSEEFSRDHDKHMHQTGNMGGDTGMHPGDAEVKEKLSRAELKERRLKRLAYMQGGSEGREPNTFKSEEFSRDHDKHMHQTGNMGGDTGMHPGDAEVKEKHSRAAYNGGPLSTRFSLKRRADGSVDRGNSVFEVFAGDKRVIAATAGQIYGNELAANWDWISSREYGKEVCSQIREAGLDAVSNLLKTAQELPDMGEMPELPPLDDAGAAPELPAEGGTDAAPELPAPELAAAEEPEAEGDELSPAEEIENRLADMEQILDEVRDFVSKLEDERMADVDVNVFTGKGEGETVSAEPGGLSALSSELLSGLKNAYRRLDNSADELSLVAETYDNISKLSGENRAQFTKLAAAAIKDADQVTGETKGLIRLAMETMHVEDDEAADTMHAEDDAMYAEDDAMYAEDGDEAMDMADSLPLFDSAEDPVMDEGADALVLEAMQLRKNRREAILKQAEENFLAKRAAKREALLNKSANFETAETEVAEANDEVAADALAETPVTTAAESNEVKDILSAKVAEKRVDEERENYRIKLRRAYDVGLEMQRKGLLAHSKTALDKQVDEIMTFDDNAFEAFKRSIANARSVSNVKVASDLGGVNIGVESETPAAKTYSGRMTADTLSSMWE